MTAADSTQLTVTTFAGLTAKHGFEDQVTWPELVKSLQEDLTYINKEAMPLFKLGAYEGASRARGSPLLHVDALASDYDAGEVSVTEAARRLQRAGIKAVLYTSASHTPEAPRWRAIAALSTPTLDEATFHAQMGVLNGALGGILASESWDWRRNYFRGRVGGRSYEVVETTGMPLDDLIAFDMAPEPVGPAVPPKAAAGPQVLLGGEDPVAQYLIANGHALGQQDDKLFVRCPLADQHRVPQGAGDTSAAWLAPTLEHPSGSYACRHTTHGSIGTGMFLRLVGYDNPADEFEEVELDLGPVGTGGKVAAPIALDWDTLPEHPEPVHFLVPEWLPDGVVTLFAAHGGTGKSYISLYIALCLAGGRHPFSKGQSIPPVKVVLYSAEDSLRVMRYRLRKYLRTMGLSTDDVKDNLLILDATESNNVLFAGDQKVNGRTTDQFDWLQAQIKSFSGELLIFDNASDAMDANENDRAKVRQFLTSLKRLAGAVLLLAHVDAISSMASPEDAKGYSGSTGWHNSVRSRWFMARVKDTDEISLTLAKNNYAKAGIEATIMWNGEHDAFEVVSVRHNKATAGGSRGLLLRLLRRVIEKRGANVSPSQMSNNSTFNVLKTEQGFPRGLKTGDVHQEVRQWLAEELVVEEEYLDLSRHTKTRLVLTAKGIELCDFEQSPAEEEVRSAA